MGASSPLTLSVESVTELQGAAEQQSEAATRRVVALWRREASAQRKSAPCADIRGVGEQGIEP